MHDKLKLLIVGDIVGKLGRRTLQATLEEWKSTHSPDAVIVNVENLAHGKGITERSLAEIKSLGIIAVTGGDHIWDKANPSETVRAVGIPAAFPANDPRTNKENAIVEVSVGNHKVFVLNLIGRVFMPDISAENPFSTFDTLRSTLPDNATVIVDIHTEATSEKVAFGYYADGRASVVYGTHTHIPTADARVLNGGTGYITDIGMTGSDAGVLGVKKEVIIDRFTETAKDVFDYAESGPAWINAILVTINPKNGRCDSIAHLQKRLTINSSP